MFAGRLVQLVYDHTLRPLLPRKIAAFNGVPVRAPRLFDMTDVRPAYEATLVDRIGAIVSRGDRIILVGGGFGVSAVHAARAAGDSGRVHVFEAAAGRADTVRETARLSRLDDRITVEHATVGSSVRVADDGPVAPTRSPSALSECDVLVLDCEGAERQILAELGPEWHPPVIVAETHPMFDAPPDVVRELLIDAGYEVFHETTEESPHGTLTFLTARVTED